MARYCDTIGVIGGMGSYSTAYFFKRFLDSFEVDEEYERPRMIIDNYCTLPNKSRAYLHGENEEELLNSIIISLQQLRMMGCTKSLIMCNTTHIFVDAIFKRNKSLKKYFIDMLDCLSKRICQDNVQKVLIWTTNNTIKTRVFEKYFSKYNIDVEYDIENNETIVDELVLAGEKNILSDQTGNKYTELCNMYDGIVPIVLGCTELSVINSNFNKSKKLKIYDPVECVLEYILMNLK